MTKTLTFLLLALLLGAGAVMLALVPASGYAVSCSRTGTPECVLERTRLSGTTRATIPLGPVASAAVRSVTDRRGRTRVFLYLDTPVEGIFAAEFEGADADTHAAAAATRLNDFLSHREQAAVRITATAPRLPIVLAWVAFGVTSVLVMATWLDTRRRALA